MRTMTRTPLSRLLSGIAGAALLITATPALASAADYTHTDATRDAVKIRLDGPGKGRTDRREAPVDIRTVRVSHTADNLVVKIRTRSALPAKKFFVGVSLRTPGGASYEVEYLKMFGTSVNELSSGGDGDRIECAGYRVGADRARRLTTVVVPTTCLGDPAWVRVGAGVARFAHKQMWADDGLVDRRIGNQLRYSPRIARG